MELIEADIRKTNPNPVSREAIQKLLVEKVIPQIAREAIANPETFVGIEEVKSNGDFSMVVANYMLAFESFLNMKQTAEEATGAQSAKTCNSQANIAVVRQIRDLLNPPLIAELMACRDTISPDPEQDFMNILKQVDADYLIRSFDAATRKRFEKDAKLWAEEVVNVVRAKYWMGTTESMGRLNLQKIRSLVSDQQKELFDRNEPEASSVCDDLLMHFAGCQRTAMRRLVENMQRCALRDLPPVPIMVESENSILRRWNAMLRKKLFGKLETLRTAEIEVHPDFDANDEDLAFCDDVRAICSIFNSPTIISEEGCRRFFEFSHGIVRKAWSAAMGELADQVPQIDFTELILEALGWCKAESESSGPSPALLKRLRELFTPG